MQTVVINVYTWLSSSVEMFTYVPWQYFIETKIFIAKKLFFQPMDSKFLLEVTGNMKYFGLGLIDFYRKNVYLSKLVEMVLLMCVL